MSDLNLLERAVAWASPQWGLKRMAAKLALEHGRIAGRSFDAARRGRRTESWRATGGSANTELSGALDLIRRRSRDLCRNNEWAANAKRKWVAHAIGTGIVPRPDAAEKRAKQTAIDAWNAFNENCDPEGLTDFYGIQARLFGEIFEGGAAFLRWYSRPTEFGLKVPLQCEVLEHDFLDTNKTEILDNGRGNVVISGVEFDGYGRRVAYWLFPVHPGEQSLIRRGGLLSRRVLASECDHVFRVDRAGQITGVPWLAPAMLRLRDAADYEEAELVRKKIEACFTVFVRREGAVSGVAQAVDQTKDGQSRRLEKIAPGLIAYVEGNGDIVTAAPNASPGYADHMDRQLYAFAAGVGLTFAQVSGNLNRVNYSSMREGKLDFWAVLDQVQWFTVIPQICKPAWRRVMSAAAGRGLQISPDIIAKWGAPRRPWVDPNADLKAESAELALGLDSWAEKVAARGYDPEELLAEIEHWAPRLKAAGLVLGAAPGQGGANAGQAAGGDPTDDAQGAADRPAGKDEDDAADDKK